MAPSPSFLTLADRRLAYQHRCARESGLSCAGVFFLGGFASDMEGSKATFLDGRCAENGIAYTRFDYRGHGLSSGRFEEGCIGDWFDDALTVFDAVAKGRQVLVGSSMGGWIGLLLARERPERVAGFVGVAAAPDFTEDLIRPALTQEQKDSLARDGFFYESAAPPEGQPDDRIPITQRLMDDGVHRLVLRAPLKIDAPIRLLQGQKDSEVPWQTVLSLASHIEQADVRVTLLKDADHRLSRESDLTLLWETLAPMLPEPQAELG